MTLSWSRLWASWFRGLKARSKNCVVFPGFSIELMTFGICAFQINIGFPHERWQICVGWYVELPDFWEAPVIFHIPIILTVQFPFEQWLLSTLLVDDFLGEQLLAQILGIINREILKNQAEKHIASGIFCGQLFSFPMKKIPSFPRIFLSPVPRIQFNLSDFTRRAYGTNYIETLRVQLHANCRGLENWQRCNGGLEMLGMRNHSINITI